jgi:putative ABC transport system ATP-binding protein
MGVIEAVELYRFYHSGDAEVIGLRGVNLSLSGGELVALLGPSGSGKSTFLNLLAGLDEPDGGHVDVQGIRLSRRSETVRADIRARHIGMYMQSGNLFDHLSVVENIRLQRRLAGKTSDDEPIMNLVNRLGLATHWNALPGELSGGEAARAGLAVALSGEPPILLCDEPTAEVDAETERQIISDLDERRHAGTAILIATHSPVLASAADRVLELQDGRLVREAGK